MSMQGAEGKDLQVCVCVCVLFMQGAEGRGIQVCVVHAGSRGQGHAGVYCPCKEQRAGACRCVCVVHAGALCCVTTHPQACTHLKQHTVEDPAEHGEQAGNEQGERVVIVAVP